MPLEIKCESCGKRYRVDDRFAGKRVKCRHCGAAILVDSDVEPDLSALSTAGSDAETEGESISSFAGAASPIKLPTSANKASAEEDDDDADEPEQAPLPAGFGEALRVARSRDGVRRFRLLAYPGVQAVDKALPWLIGLACLIPVIWQGINAARATTPAWAGFTLYGLTLLLFLVLVVPLTTRGMRIAAQMLHFELPDTAGWRTLGIYSLPFALAALFYWQIEGIAGLIFGLAVGVLVVGPLLLVVMQLHWVEAVIAWMMSALFFAGSVAVTAGVLFVVGLVITASTVGAANKPPTKAIVKATTKPAIVTPTTEPVVQTPPQDPFATTLVPTTEPTAVVLPTPPDDGGILGKLPVVLPPVVTPPPTDIKPPVAVPSVKPDHIVVSPSPIVKTVRELETLGDIDALLNSDVAGGSAVVLKRTPEADRLVSLDLAKSAAGGEVSFKRDVQASDHYVATPGGDAIARIASWPKLRAELLPLTTSRAMKAINLNDTNGVATLLGVASNDTMLVGWQNNGQFAIEPWSLRTGLAGRGFRVPMLIPNGSAISGDGKMLAVSTKVDGPAQVMLFDVLSGRFRKLPITALDVKWPLEPVALTFSPDSSRLAICFEHDGGILVVSWNAATGKPFPDQTYAAGMLPIPVRTSFTGRALDWAGDNNTWLLYGQTLVDANSGAVLGVMGIDHVISQHVVDAKSVMLVSKVNSGTNRLVQLELDPAAIAKLRPAPPK